MKKIIILFGLLTIIPVHADPPGSVVFFYFSSDKNIQDEAEVSADFYFYYKKLKESFINKGFEVMLVEKEPLKIKKPNFSINLSSKELGSNVGTVFVKPSGQYQVNQGIGTDIDELLSAEKFFGVKILTDQTHNKSPKRDGYAAAWLNR